MKNIELLENFKIGEISESGKSKEVKEIFNGERRRLVAVKLRDGASLAKHKAAEPITIMCLAGKGLFRAGVDLSDECEFRTGTLVTLAGGVEHEVVAHPALDLLVSNSRMFRTESRLTNKI